MSVLGSRVRLKTGEELRLDSTGRDEKFTRVRMDIDGSNGAPVL